MRADVMSCNCHGWQFLCFSFILTNLLVFSFFCRLTETRPPKPRRSQQDAPQGCPLSQLLLSLNQSPRKPPLRRQPRGRRATLLKMGMPRQIRHRRLKLLPMPNES